MISFSIDEPLEEDSLPALVNFIEERKTLLEIWYSPSIQYL